MKRLYYIAGMLVSNLDEVFCISYCDSNNFGKTTEIRNPLGKHLVSDTFDESIRSRGHLRTPLYIGKRFKTMQPVWELFEAGSGKTSKRTCSV